MILIVGRLSGPKNKVLLSILQEVAPRIIQKIPTAKFIICGGPVKDEHRILAQKYNFIRFEGHQKDLKSYYQKADIVIGAGRVALEAMSLKKPVIAIGERVYVGPLFAKNIEQAKYTNFGDCFEKEIFNWEQMFTDILSLLENEELRHEVSQTGYKLFCDEYNMTNIFPQINALYKNVILHKNISLFHELPVLMYHSVLERKPAYSKFNTYIVTADLEKQLQSLKARGFETITFQDLVTQKIPKKPIILTFDDGYENNYTELFPLLKKYQMKAVIYILGDRTYTENSWDVPYGELPARLLNAEQILEMASSGLIEFGAHSMSHKKLTELPMSEARHEIFESKKLIEDLIGQSVLSFAYPYGAHNTDIKQITLEAGYVFGVAVTGNSSRFSHDLMAIERVNIFRSTSSFGFWKKTNGFYFRYQKLKKLF